MGETTIESCGSKNVIASNIRGSEKIANEG